MLANFQHPSTQVGSLGRDVHLPATSLLELLNFVSDELPHWRDRPDRKSKTSETSLTSQLCAHLNSAARHASGWDFLQFRTEEPDEKVKGRTIDLVPAPSNATVWVEGRSYVDFDALLPIECKRLPTPNGKDRDEREYVFNRHASTGGIQRFKAGHHGAAHKLGGMIAYIQQETCVSWNTQVAQWINDLTASGQKGWTANDLLHLEQNDTARQVAILNSSHKRENGLLEIKLRHLCCVVQLIGANRTPLLAARFKRHS
jgi:hypothetical protein